MDKFSRDIICLVNQGVFGDKEEHQVEMEFFDGYALSMNRSIGLTYPMLKHLSKTMRSEVEDYTGRELESPFDIALLYAKPFRINENRRTEKEHDFLMSILEERQVSEYAKFCESYEEREYILVYLDTQTDCGMDFWYGGVFGNVDEAHEHFHDYVKGAKLYNDYREDYQTVLAELKIDDAAKVERVWLNESHAKPNGEYFYLISRPVDEATDVVLIWNRNDRSSWNENEVRFFSEHPKASSFAADAKVREFHESLENFGITWNMEPIKTFNYLKTLYPSFNIWGNDGYNVHIIHGKYKE